MNSIMVVEYEFDWLKILFAVWSMGNYSNDLNDANVDCMALPMELWISAPMAMLLVAAALCSVHDWPLLPLSRWPENANPALVEVILGL